MPISSANWRWEMPLYSISSLIISPGWVGKAGFILFAIISCAVILLLIYNFLQIYHNKLVFTNFVKINSITLTIAMKICTTPKLVVNLQ